MANKFTIYWYSVLPDQYWLLSFHLKLNYFDCIYTDNSNIYLEGNLVKQHQKRLNLQWYTYGSEMIFPLPHFCSFHSVLFIIHIFTYLQNILKISSISVSLNVKAYSKNRHRIPNYAAILHDNFNAHWLSGPIPVRRLVFIWSRSAVFVSLFYFLSPVIPTDRTDTNE